MRINLSSMLSNVNSIQSSDNSLKKIQEKLSTGKRINRASDDASGRAMAEELLKQTRSFKTGSSNVTDFQSALKIADGAGTEVSSMLQRQRELAIQASNGTLNAQDRESLNSEYQALNEEINRTSRSTQFNGQALTDGSSPLSDGTGNIQVSGNEGDSLKSANVNMSVSALGGGGDISSVEGAKAALASADTALKNLNQSRSQIGAKYNAAEYALSNSQSQEVNTTSALSSLEDLDMAKGIMDQVRESLLNKSSIDASKNFNNIARNNMMALLNG